MQDVSLDDLWSLQNKNCKMILTLLKILFTFIHTDEKRNLIKLCSGTNHTVPWTQTTKNWYNGQILSLVSCLGCWKQDASKPAWFGRQEDSDRWRIWWFLEDALLNCSGFCSEKTKTNRLKLLDKVALAPNRMKCLDGGEHSLFWLTEKRLDIRFSSFNAPFRTQWKPIIIIAALRRSV